jgi:hypothetical protein
LAQRLDRIEQAAGGYPVAGGQGRDARRRRLRQHLEQGRRLLLHREVPEGFGYRVPGGLGLFDQALKLAPKKAIDFNIEGLRVDIADAKFFAGGLAEINQAIKTTKAAIDKLNPDYPRRFLWSLGWAYYERAYFTEKKEDYVKSLDALLQISNPTGAVLKNIIASKAALGWTKPAQRLAREFRARNPDYSLAIEERWPYRDLKRLQRWQGHLGSSTLSRK